MKHLESVIPVVPVGKARPRMTKTGHVYTPNKTKDFEKVIAMCWETQTNCGKVPSKTPICVFIEAAFPIPKSVSKKRRELMISQPHIKKPDADNVAKAVLDALNGVAYEDDSGIYYLTVHKLYAEEPSIRIVLSWHEKYEGMA